MTVETWIAIICASILGVCGGISAAVVSYFSNRTRQHQIVVDAVIKMHQLACDKLYDPMHQATREEATNAYKELIKVIKAALDKE